MDLRLLLKCDKLNNYPFPNLVVAQMSYWSVVISIFVTAQCIRVINKDLFSLTNITPSPPNITPSPPNPCMEFLKLRTPLNKFYNIFHLLLIYLSSKSCYWKLPFYQRFLNKIRFRKELRCLPLEGNFTKWKNFVFYSYPLFNFQHFKLI